MSVLDKYLDNIVREIVNPLILLLIAVAFAVFVWGIFKFVRDADDEKKVSEGRVAIFWGLIGFVVMFGVYGILNLATSTFNLDPVSNLLK